MWFRKHFKKFLTTIPLLLMMLFVVGHPTRAEAAELVLDEEMTSFVQMGDYKIIQTKGAALNKMFGCSLNEEEIYIAYYQIDRKATSSHTWHTHTLYWTKKPVKGYSVSAANLREAGKFFQYNVCDTPGCPIKREPSKSNKEQGKKSFTKYYTSVTKKDGGYSTSGKTQHSVSAGMVGTLFYFSTESGTKIGDKFKDFVNPKDGTVTFYVSPLIVCKYNRKAFYNCSSWFNGCAWADRNYSHYTSHYNHKIKFKFPTVRVETSATVVGNQKDEDDTMLFQPNLGKASSSARDIKDSDYIWGSKMKDGKAVQLKGSGIKTTETTKTVMLAPFGITVPISGQTGSVEVKTDKKGNTQTFMPVGYRIYKTVKVDGEKKKICIGNVMVEMKKNSAKETVPYFVEEKSGAEVTPDEASTTENISKPQKLNDQTLTIKAYNVKGKNGYWLTDHHKDEEISVSEWKNLIKKGINWPLAVNSGVRNEDDDRAMELHVDWFYAPTGISPAGNPTVTLEQYYTTGEGVNIETSETPSVDDSKDLSYPHDKGSSKLYGAPKVLAQLNAGDPWVSYSVEKDKNGAYKLKDGTAAPKSRTGDASDIDAAAKKNGKNAGNSFVNTKPDCGFSKDDLKEKKDVNSKRTVSEIPYVLKNSVKSTGYNSTNNTYLYKVVIETADDGRWTQFTADEIWGGVKPRNGKITGKSDKKGNMKGSIRSFTTNAPYMRDYVWVNDKTPGQIRDKRADTDWSTDAFNMTHFIIPEVRSNVTIKAYYTKTLPVRTLVYKRSSENGSYVLDNSQTKLAWVSPGTEYTGKYSEGGGGVVTAMFAGTGFHAHCHPYAYDQVKKESFKSVESAEKFFPSRTNLTADSGHFTLKMPEQPAVVCIFVDSSPTTKYFTQVQYVHTQDGKYHFIKSWRQKVNPYGPSVNHWLYYVSTKYGGYDVYCPGNRLRAHTVKAFVSFPQYVSYDDGNTGLYGSLYEEQGIDYDYSGKRTFEKTLNKRPGSFHKDNNSTIYLTQLGNTTEQKYGNTTKTDNIVKNPAGGDNSLVCYCIYEDIFNDWENSQFNPDNDTDNPLTIEEEGLPWNWPLPKGFVWDSLNITEEDNADQTVYGDEYSNPFVAQVLGTQKSAVFNAQEGIPTTDMVRTQAQVPRYLTKGYWTRNKLAWAYKVHAVYVKQTKSSKRIMAGDNDGHHGSSSENHGTYHKNCSCEPSYQYYDYYVSEEVHSEQTVDVRRDSVYYTLGDAEVWDPYYVTMKNDVFSDTIISKDDTVTMYGDGTQRAFPSNARFTKTGDGAFQLPSVKVKRQYVNYGTYNDWESDDVADSLAKDLEHLQQDADSIIDKFMVKSDTVDFFDGFKIYRLSDGSMGLKTSVQIPSFPPESELTSPGDFDSYNNVPDGIMIKPTKNNGHHETVSIAYYKQIQCIPTDKYKTDEMIKTKVIDDGDDDVMVYTPAVNDSQINLDYSSKATGADKIKLGPNDNYDQATEHGIQDTFTNIQLDREYTMTLSVLGEASDLDGYGYQDYVRYLALDKYGNPYTQVRFPFPVQMVSRTLQNGKVVTDDRYYYANTWIDIEMIDEDGRVSGKINQTFFVPSWATELEKVTIKFRSPAINCDANNPERNMEDELTNDSFVDESLRTKDRYNAIDERNYVAWKSETDTVTGRISSFQIIDVTDYPAWQPVFRKYDKEKGKYTTELTGKAYHSGICNEYGFLENWGSLYTTPVVGTSNPAGASMGTLGFGYKIRYKMTTVGPYYNKTDTLTFKPEFYWVNDEGKYLQIDGTYKTSMDTRAKVDVYYNETFSGKNQTLVRVGSKQDKNNQKSLTLTDDAWNVKKERIDFTNSTLHTSNVGETEPQYTFSGTCMTTSMRTVDGDTHVSAHRGNPLDKAETRQYEFNQRMYNTVKAVGENPDAYKDTDYETLASKLTPEQVARSVQTWYGEYYLPSECFVTASSWDTVKKQIEGGFDGSEDCWLKGGHLVINFNPQINSETKQTLRYSVETKEQYTEEDGSVNFAYWGCNQFKHENCVASKLLASGEVIPFASGDVLIYDLTNGGKDSPPKAPSAKEAYDSSGSH